MSANYIFLPPEEIDPKDMAKDLKNACLQIITIFTCMYTYQDLYRHVMIKKLPPVEESLFGEPLSKASGLAP